MCDVSAMSTLAIIGLILLALLLLVVVYDVVQTKHAILRNYPIVGHLRYILEAFGPELRQYIVTSNDEERPFSRDQRRWVYASSKKQNNYFGFGTDGDMELSGNYLIIRHAAFPLPEKMEGEEGYDPRYSIPCLKTMGGPRGRKHAFQPDSIVFVSGMSYGSLSSAAVEAINRGLKMSGGLHNTGEGSISKHHDHGADLVYQIGTGYFGCRTDDGNLDIDKLVERVKRHNVKAIEFKLSQGAKPGRGGVLPAAKITQEISDIRGIPLGKDCISPSYHRAFGNIDEMLDVVETVAERTGLPVGIKAAVGELDFWHQLAEEMARGERGVDFIAIDGGEGGTGAAPLAFSDNVALPFKLAFSSVYRIFRHAGIEDDIVWLGMGRLGFPEIALLAYALGVDMVGVAREAMLAIGCIQAQKCHTGQCPAGVATQNAWLMRGLDPTHKSARLANYIVTLRKELMWLSYACGVDHPSKVRLEQFEILDDRFGSRSATEVFGYSRTPQLN